MDRYAVTQAQGDTRVYTGTIDITLTGNTLSGSLLAPGLISFTREQTTLNPAQLPSWQYLHNAIYTITDPRALWRVT
jgi:hypothetical protein